MTDAKQLTDAVLNMRFQRKYLPDTDRKWQQLTLTIPVFDGEQGLPEIDISGLQAGAVLANFVLQHASSVVHTHFADSALATKLADLAKRAFGHITSVTNKEAAAPQPADAHAATAPQPVQPHDPTLPLAQQPKPEEQK